MTVVIPSIDELIQTHALCVLLHYTVLHEWCGLVQYHQLIQANTNAQHQANPTSLTSLSVILNITDRLVHVFSYWT